MILHNIEEVKTLGSQDLFKVMRWASKQGRSDVFKACFQRAKELNHVEVSTWEEAKQKFEFMVFPTWKESKSQLVKVLGYPCEISLEMDSTMQIKNQYMALMSPKRNSCIIRWFIKKGEVQFS